MLKKVFNCNIMENGMVLKCNGFHVYHLYRSGMALSRLLSKGLFEAVLG